MFFNTTRKKHRKLRRLWYGGGDPELAKASGKDTGAVSAFGAGVLALCCPIMSTNSAKLC